MQPFSHFVIAARLEAQLRPAAPADYYWGAVVPDIRVTAGLPRTQTHIPPEQVLDLRRRHPQLDSFIKGYAVHLLSDLVEVEEMIQARPLMTAVLRRGGPKFAHILIEAYAIERQRVQRPVAIRHNEILAELGVSAAHVDREREFMQPYLQQPSQAITLAYLKSTGGAQLAGAIVSLQRCALRRAVLYHLAGLARIHAAAAGQVARAPLFREL